MYIKISTAPKNRLTKLLTSLPVSPSQCRYKQGAHNPLVRCFQEKYSNEFEEKFCVLCDARPKFCVLFLRSRRNFVFFCDDRPLIIASWQLMSAHVCYGLRMTTVCASQRMTRHLKISQQKRAFRTSMMITVKNSLLASVCSNANG